LEGFVAKTDILKPLFCVLPLVLWEYYVIASKGQYRLLLHGVFVDFFLQRGKTTYSEGIYADFARYIEENCYLGSDLFLQANFT